jgi:hypothetical protein
MQYFRFVFLRRRWEEDEAILTRKLRYFRDAAKHLQLLLFPEGTDLSADNQRRDAEFARKNGLSEVWIAQLLSIFVSLCLSLLLCRRLSAVMFLALVAFCHLSYVSFACL